MILDSHAHYSRRNFDGIYRFLGRGGEGLEIREGTRDEILKQLKENGIVGAIEPAVELGSNPVLLDFCGKHPGFYPAVGVHPTKVADLRLRDGKTLFRWASGNGVVAIGETGLDYHLARKDQHRLRQFFWFQRQIDLAARLHLPLVLHIRLAYKDAIRILRRNRRKLNGGVAHCFLGTKEDATALIGLGFRIGIGGALLRSDETAAELQETVRAIPLEKILAETDAPYVLPDLSRIAPELRKKGKLRNTSLLLPEVIGKIAELKGVSRETAEETIFRNTAEAFVLSGNDPAFSSGSDGSLPGTKR